MQSNAGEVIEILEEEGNRLFKRFVEMVNDDLLQLMSMFKPKDGSLPQIGSFNQSIQMEVIEELKRLLAVVQEERNRRQYFRDGPSGDGPTGPPQPQPLIPPVVELILLRAEQQRIHGNWDEFNLRTDMQKNLDEISKLVKDRLARKQGDLHETTREVIGSLGK